MTPDIIEEIAIVDLLAFLLSVAAVEIVWYCAKKAFPTEVGNVQFFVMFILIIVPFVMLICFGLAIINYDLMAMRSGWPPALPLKNRSSPLILGAVIFYIAQAVWLWWDWRKQLMLR